MTGTLSPDGKWMWDGEQWIPAPPTEHSEITDQFIHQNHNKEPELSYTPTPPPGGVVSSVYNFDNEKNPTTPETPRVNYTSKNKINSFTIEVIAKKMFPVPSIKFAFLNPTTGVHHKIKIAQVFRNFSAEDEHRNKVGKIKLKGVTMYSGAAGNLTLSDGGVFRVDMDTSIFGIKKESFTLTDLSTGAMFRTY